MSLLSIVRSVHAWMHRSSYSFSSYPFLSPLLFVSLIYLRRIYIGQSRSVTIIIAHLLKQAITAASDAGQPKERERGREGSNPSSSTSKTDIPEVHEILQRLRQSHPKAHPNPGFMKQLEDFRSNLIMHSMMTTTTKANDSNSSTQNEISSR